MTTPPKTMAEIRDEEAEKFWNNINRNAETIHARTIFKHGWDCRDKLDNEALKIAVEALEKINQQELNSMRPGGGYSQSATVSFETLAKIRKLRGE